MVVVDERHLNNQFTDRPKSHVVTSYIYNFWACHRSSPKYVIVSTPTFLFTFLISSVESFRMPIATACSLPSACKATGVPAGSPNSAGGRYPPLEVIPGHIMCAPCNKNRIAPRSIPTTGSTDGSITRTVRKSAEAQRIPGLHLCKVRRVG